MHHDKVHERIWLFFNRFIRTNFWADKRLSLKPLVPEPGGSWPSSGRRGLSSGPERAWHGSTYDTKQAQLAFVGCFSFFPKVYHSFCARLVQNKSAFDVSISHLFFLTSLGGFFSWTGFSRMVAWAFLYISSIWKTDRQSNFHPKVYLHIWFISPSNHISHAKNWTFFPQNKFRRSKYFLTKSACYVF